jgi:hypothetical protein
MGDIFGKPDPPPAPDYVGAARAQGASNLETAIATSKLSNPWTQNAYGSRRVLYGDEAGTGDPLVPRVIDSMTPLGESRAAQEQRIIGSLGNTAEAGLYRVGDAFNTPMDMQSITDLQNKAQSAIMDRVNPELDRQQRALDQQLVNQGFTDRNSEGYRAAQDAFGRQRNDATTQAALQAINLQPQLMQSELAIRNQPLNELNALRTGSQVQLPNFGQTRGAGVGDTPILGATQAQAQNNAGLYNSQVGSYNNQMSGLYGLGSAALIGWLASDVRVKEDVRMVGSTDEGLPVYTFRYKGDPVTQMGVMAQDVEKVNPAAVKEISGVKHVNYAMVR